MKCKSQFHGALAATAVALALGCGVEDALDGEPDAFTAIYESNEFQECSGCHAPGAPGRVDGTEETQDWSTRDAAYISLQGTASGLIGNFAGCNGVPFLGPSAEQSLLFAAFDQDARRAYDNPDFPDCNEDSISDQTLKLGGDLPAGLLADLRAWIDDGAPSE